jgi:hypothetical protein
MDGSRGFSVTFKGSATRIIRLRRISPSPRWSDDCPLRSAEQYYLVPLLTPDQLTVEPGRSVCQVVNQLCRHWLRSVMQSRHHGLDTGSQTRANSFLNPPTELRPSLPRESLRNALVEDR